MRRRYRWLLFPSLPLLMGLVALQNGDGYAKAAYCGWYEAASIGRPYLTTVAAGAGFGFVMMLWKIGQYALDKIGPP